MSRLRQLRHASTMAVALTMFAPGACWAQVVANPNQIRGRIEFSNTSSQVLDLLVPAGGDEGLRSGTVRGHSQILLLDHSTTAVVDGSTRTTATYELTVESDITGAAYDMTVGMSLHFDGQNHYQMKSAVSDPVFPEPAPDVILDFIECAGVLDIRWQTAAGVPVEVDGGTVAARRGPGFNELQARNFEIDAGSNQTYLVVRGDSTNYRIQIRYVMISGSDPYHDLLRYEGLCEVERVVDCEEIDLIVCVVPDDPFGGGGGGLGLIRGRMDVIGEHENRVAGLTLAVAEHGPYSNYRLDTIGFDPSEGDFELENLVPGGVGYVVFTETNLRLGRRSQFMHSPMLAGVNGRVPVAPFEDVDLGNTFVLDPGFVQGEILLAGPPPGPLGSCLEDLRRNADDLDPRGVPTNPNMTGRSILIAEGTAQRAPGANRSSFGGSVRAGFEGDFNPASGDFEGDHDIVLGGLSGESSLWDVTVFEGVFIDQTTPNLPLSYQNSRATITNRLIPLQQIDPGQVRTVDHRYCFSQVNLGFRSNGGTFFNPRVVQTPGSYSALDFLGNLADYWVTADATGTPLDQSTASTDGLVVMCVPQGDYVLRPFVTSANPGGGTSTTQLPSIPLRVGCRQSIDVSADCRLELEALPFCSTTRTLTVGGEFTGDGTLSRIYHQVNGGAVIDCVGCSSVFTIDVELDTCVNEVKVVAETVQGDTCAVTSFIRFDDQPPEITALLVPLPATPPGSGSSCSAPIERSYRVECGITDNCDGDPEVSAELHVINYREEHGVCFAELEIFPVACGAIVDVELTRPSCNPTPPEPPRPASSVNSEIRGDSIVLRVTGRDACGNEGVASYDAADAPCDPPHPLDGDDRRRARGPVAPALTHRRR